MPSLGSLDSRLLIVGLAPAAHGGNRTGRIFTGDRSGDWLYRALHRFGFANQPQSIDRNDGLRLIDCYITAAVHCAPPDNKPTPEEFANCRPYFLEELQRLKKVRVVIPLGLIAFKTYFAGRKELGWKNPSPLPAFQPWRRDRAGRRHSYRVVLSPEPAKHTNRQADRSNVR